MKVDIVMVKPLALLMGACLCLSACLVPSDAAHKVTASRSYCEAVAHYIASQYATLPNRLLPNHTALYDNNPPATGFVTIDAPSLYDVAFQHKGFEAVIGTCLTRHQTD